MKYRPLDAVAITRRLIHIFIYKKGMSAPRQMTRRLLMKLDTEQMNHARRLARRRTACCH